MLMWSQEWNLQITSFTFYACCTTSPETLQRLLCCCERIWAEHLLLHCSFVKGELWRKDILQRSCLKTVTSQQGANQMIWLHLWAAVTLSSFICGLWSGHNAIQTTYWFVRLCTYDILCDLSFFPGSSSSPQGPGPSHSGATSGPQGLRKHFLRGKLDCDNQPPDPDRLFQRCFMATVTSINVEGPA